MSEHGTRSRYVRGCRCAPCTEANRVYIRRLDRHHRRVAYGIEAPQPERYVDATEARQHLIWLRSVGVGRRAIHRRSGVSESALQKITQGARTRITARTAERILAVGQHDRRAGAMVDATDTWRKIDELRSHGWTYAAISAAIGNNGRALQLSRDRIRWSNAQKIAELYATAMAPIIARRQAEAERQANYRARKAAA